MLGIVGVVEELFRELEKEIDNLRGLKDNLEKSLDDRTVWESIKNCAQNVAVVSDEETEYFFSGYLLKQRKCSGAYAIFSINEVVALEVKRIDDLGRELRKCEKCGRYFVPVQFGAVNCGYPNSEYGNKSCGAIAKNEKYIMNIKGDPISSEFAIRRRNFCQWKRDQFRGKNIGLLREEIDILMKKDGDVKNSVEDYINRIRMQIEESYQSWIKRCENAIYELRNGNISEDECIKQFETFSNGTKNSYTKGKYGGVSELLDYVKYYSRV
jgi:hypothetical protein